MKNALAEPSRDSTPSPLRRAKKEVVENKLKEEVGYKDKEIWLLELMLQNRGAHLSLKR